MVRLGMILDLQRCVGCGSCVIACKAEHGTPPNILFARVMCDEVGKYPKVTRVFFPTLCFHCKNPPCMTVCPTKAIYKRPDGIVLIDSEKCGGHQSCVAACPYNAISPPTKKVPYYPEGPTPYEVLKQKNWNEKVATKCTLCYHRVDQGFEPACVVICPCKARIFGDLDDPNSAPSMYLKTRGLKEGVPPVRPLDKGFPILPEKETQPSVLYVR